MVSQTDVRAGEVTRVSGYGFQLNGEARWYNLSKFVKGLELPTVGDTVEIRLNKGYVVQVSRRAGGPGAGSPRSGPPPARTASSLSESSASGEPPDIDLDDLPFEPLAGEAPPFIDPDELPFNEPLEEALDDIPLDVPARSLAPAMESPLPRLPEKDVQIVRMNAITNAVAILSSGGRVCEPNEVLQLATRLESWVTR